MNKLAIMLAVGLTYTAGSASAQDDQQAGQDTRAAAELQQQQVEADELAEEDERMQEVVCKTDKITGSLVRRKRTCMTRAEWNEVNTNAQEGHAEMVRSASGSKCFGCE